MATTRSLNVQPFQAVRPSRDKVHLVASRSYVSYTVPQLRKKLHENPYSYLHIIHPDLGPRKLHRLDQRQRFELVRNKYEAFLREGILFRDESPGFYIYRQTKNGHAFVGLIAAVAVDDYLEGRIRIHEHTLSSRQEIFTNYLDTTGVNAEPVLLFSRDMPLLDRLIENYSSERPEYDFTQVTRVRHEMWPVTKAEDLAAIHTLFEKEEALYIADGHHRCASSASLCLKRREHNNERSAPWNYFLAFILQESNLRIYGFNRLVKDLHGMSPEEFLEKLQRICEVKKMNQVPQLAPRTCGLYLDHCWYSLTLNSVDRTPDAQVLSDQILIPVLGITDIRKDKRIGFSEGPRGTTVLEHAVDRGHFAAAFVLSPVEVHELRHAADQHLTMPPKSTWIEPKLRSGMIIYELDRS